MYELISWIFLYRTRFLILDPNLNPLNLKAGCPCWLLDAIRRQRTGTSYSSKCPRSWHWSRTDSVTKSLSCHPQRWIWLMRRIRNFQSGSHIESVPSKSKSHEGDEQMRQARNTARNGQSWAWNSKPYRVSTDLPIRLISSTSYFGVNIWCVLHDEFVCSLSNFDTCKDFTIFNSHLSRVVDTRIIDPTTS